MTDERQPIIVYGHPFCTLVAPVKRILKDANADFKYINVLEDVEARQQVQRINDGYVTVPTLVFPDGSILTEPEPRGLRTKLEALGYDVDRLSTQIAYFIGMLTSWPMLIVLAFVVALALSIMGVL